MWSCVFLQTLVGMCGLEVWCGLLWSCILFGLADWCGIVWACILLWSSGLVWACVGLQAGVVLKTGVGFCGLGVWIGFADWCGLSEFCVLVTAC